MNKGNLLSKKNIVFRYEIWRRFFSTFLILVFFILPVFIGFSSQYNFWIGLLAAFILFFIFDFGNGILFGKFKIEENELVFIPGGILVKWMRKVKIYPYAKYNFEVVYFHYKNKLRYSDLIITDTNNKKRLVLEPRLIPHFDILLENLKENNPNTRLISLEERTREKFYKLKGWIKNLFS
ncbi:hypothetical protein ACFL1N_12955 [Thermodesulfobacteriota bacterium]